MRYLRYALMVAVLGFVSATIASPAYAAADNDVAGNATEYCKSLKGDKAKQQCSLGYTQAGINGLLPNATKSKVCNGNADCEKGYTAGFKKYEPTLKKEEKAKKEAAAKEAADKQKARSILGTPKDLGIPALSISHVAKNIISILSFIVGFISVIFIAVAGVKYSASNGNPNQIQSAKQTLTYAITGLIVSLMAYGIVGFVLSRGPN